MGQATYVQRRGAIYHYRRRCAFGKQSNQTITVSLRTADPSTARRRAARLSVRWDETVMTINMNIKRGVLSATEITGLFREGLNTELGSAVASLCDIDPVDLAKLKRTNRILEAALRVIKQIDPQDDEIPAVLIDRYTEGWDPVDKSALEKTLKFQITPRVITEQERIDALEAISAPVTESTIRDARQHLIQGQIEAYSRSQFIDHPKVQETGDPLTALMDDRLIASLKNSTSTQTNVEPVNVPNPAPPPKSPNDDCPFLERDQRRFSEIIEPVIAEKLAAKEWNPDMAQRRRVIQSFAWITGDKPLCDYRPSDIDAYCKALTRLPTSFKFGTPTEGPMSRPFAEVIAGFPPTAETPRHTRTFNRDLTILAAVAEILKKAPWKGKYGTGTIMDFVPFTRSIEDKPDEPDRMPWTSANLDTLFTLPLYTGGGGNAKRLRKVADPKIFHDAAYWVPMLAVYATFAREEVCGLEVGDVVFDSEVPHFVIKNNMTRSKDGVSAAGLKSPSRGRVFPIHPELLRLGFEDYVTAIREEGHKELFPELYGEHKKRGGTRFYACAWRYICDAVDARSPLLRTETGKRADFHSLRTTAGSVLEQIDIKQIYADDMMGHARTGTGPRKYGRRKQAVGAATILSERLTILVKHFPVVTAHLQPSPIRMLHLSRRSATGAASKVET